MNTAKNKFGLKISIWQLGALILITLISLSVSLAIFNKTNGILDKRIAEAEEAARPADISITIVKESSCTDCFDIGPAIEAIKKENVKVNSEKTVEIASLEGKKLIDKFNIIKAPTLIITGEIEKNANLKSLWPKLGEIKNGAFIMKQIGAPYVLINSGEIRGRIKITMLKDNSCADCYNVASHLPILGRLGLPAANQELIDINSQKGKKLTGQYNIKLLPTVILTGDLDAYPTLKQIWPQVGTIEKDGAYVFRSGVKNMGTYKDLTINKIIKPAGGEVKKIAVSGTEFSFNPSNIKINKGENIQITFLNKGSVIHDFAIDELGIKTKALQPGQSETIKFTADKSGIFSFYCSVNGHRDAGMEGKMEIQ